MTFNILKSVDVLRKQSLLERVKYHYRGNAEGSTLRKTPGCLLAWELGIEFRRVGFGKQMSLAEGEQGLIAWMAETLGRPPGRPPTAVRAQIA